VKALSAASGRGLDDPRRSFPGDRVLGTSGRRIGEQHFAAFRHLVRRRRSGEDRFSTDMIRSAFAVSCIRVVICAACLLVAACGQRSTTRHGTPALVLGGPPGGLLDIGGGRRLFVHCSGTGAPVVVLESGAGADATEWQAVQPAVSRMTRTCAYDRAGTGSSVAPAGIRDGRDEVSDLERLLAHLRLAPPYVLVGHSFGGVIARAYAGQHPADTAGLVLVDSVGRHGRRRQLAIWPKREAPAQRRQIATTVLDGVDLASGEALADRTTTLGAMPLAVLSAGRQDNFPKSPPELARATRRSWNRTQQELAALSTNSIHAVAVRSNHDIPSPDTGQPAVVIDAVRAVLHAARQHTRLPPCQRVFGTAAVRCVPLLRP
jgi:pimeloyl-ACP methyl ester carboxylesterase